MTTRGSRLDRLESGRTGWVSLDVSDADVDRLVGVMPDLPPDLTDQQQVAWMANWMETNRE
jgi:hypothetical protein